MAKKKSKAARNIENREVETPSDDESSVSVSQSSFSLLSGAIENSHLNNSEVSSGQVTASHVEREMDMGDSGDVDASETQTTVDMESPQKEKKQAKEYPPTEDCDSFETVLKPADEVSDSPKKKKKKEERLLHDKNPVWEDACGDEAAGIPEHEDVSKSAKRKKKKKHKRKRNEDSIAEDTVQSGNTCVEETSIIKSLAEPGLDDMNNGSPKKKKKRDHKTQEKDDDRNINKIDHTTYYVKLEPADEIEASAETVPDDQHSSLSMNNGSPKKKKKREHKTQEEVNDININQIDHTTNYENEASAETVPDDQHSSPSRKRKKKKKRSESGVAVDLDSTVELSESMGKSPEKLMHVHLDSTIELSVTEDSAGKSPEKLTDVYDFHAEDLPKRKEKSGARTKEGKKQKKKRKTDFGTTDENGRLIEKENGGNVTTDDDEISGSVTTEERKRTEKEKDGNVSPTARVSVDRTINQQCYLCQEQMTSKLSYIFHLAEVHEKKSFQCPKCQRPLASDQGVQDHLTVCCPLKHSPALVPVFQCSLCPLSYTHKKSLNRHMRTEHGIGPPPKHEKCSHCDKEFSSKQRLKSHEVKCQEGLLKKHHGEDLECEQCGKVFSSQPARSYHMRTIHGGHIFDCVCGKQFRGSNHYYSHKAECTL